MIFYRKKDLMAEDNETLQKRIDMASKPAPVPLQERKQQDAAPGLN
jgi:hypothetical protein